MPNLKESWRRGHLQCHLFHTYVIWYPRCYSIKVTFLRLEILTCCLILRRPKQLHICLWYTGT